jgi:type III secretory pathway component EscS
MDYLTQDFMNECLRVLFLLIIPIAGAGLLASLLAALLQVITSFQDPVFSYCFRLVACLAVIGLLSGSFAHSLKALLIGALQ